jgi:sulfhydrogenase subunit beta (sulfur reductase)
VRSGSRGVIDPVGLDALIGQLSGDGYRVVGPTLRDGAVVYDEIASVADLPAGWTDEQDGGTYRLQRRPDEALFGYAVGPHSWKRYLFPPRTMLWRASRSDEGITLQPGDEAPPRYAFLGVRGCELAAIRIQDKVFLESGAVDPVYAARRGPAFIVAVNCSTPAGTCFCVSMGTGPAAGAGFDLALTEVMDGGKPHFVVEVGTDRGGELLERVPHREAVVVDEAQAASVVEGAAERMGRTLDTEGIGGLLASNREHARWDDVAERCLSCGNCTMVCPTCFCSSVEDTSDLTGSTAERWRRWDSCYTLDFSHLPDGSVRTSTRSRYRQWLTHKLGTWIDQFGTSGCVGCGRCITWCPVGIDLTEEIPALRGPDALPKE